MLDTKIGKACVVVLVLLAGALGVLLWRGSGQTGATPPPSVAPAAPTDLSGAVDASDAGVQNIIDHSTQSEIVGVREDGSKAYQINADSINPGDDGRYDITNVDATVYTGSLEVRLRAPHADLVIPNSQEGPRSGRISGGVVIELLPELRAVVGGAPRAAEPMATIELEEVRFDATLGQFETSSVVSVRGSDGEARIDTLTVRIDDSTSPVRLIYASAGPGELRWLPGGSGGAQVAKRPDGRGTFAGAAAPGAGSRTIDHLGVALAGGVRVEHRGTTIEAPAMDLLMELLNGALAEGAVAEYRLASSGGAGPGSSSAPGASGAGDGEAVGAEPIVVTWGGSLTVEARDDHDDVKASLGDELLRAEFNTSGPGGGERVRLAHAESGAWVESASLAYGATTRSIDLSPPEGGRVEGSLPELGRIETGPIALDLTRGMGTFLEGGAFAAVDDTGRGISWGGVASLTFDVSRGPVGAGGLVLPADVRLVDDVTLRDGGGTVSGDTARAWFRTIDTEDGAVARMTRASVTDDARADWGEDGSVNADRLEVVFDPAQAQPVPISALATGGVSGAFEGSTLACGALDATLVRVDARTEVEAFHAEDSVVLESGDGWRVDGDTIDGDALAGTASVRGTPAVLSSVDLREGGSITGDRIDVSRGDRRISVPGAGNATWALASDVDDAGGHDRLQVTWAGSLDYFDAEGRADVRGGVTSEARMKNGERHSAEGRALTLYFDPADGSGDGGTDLTMGTTRGERRLLRVTLDGTPDEPATGEWRRLVAQEPGGALDTLDSLVEVRGQTMSADLERSTFDVPGPGRLVVENRRPDGGATPRANTPVEVGAQGTSVFAWQTSLAVRQDEGVARMSGGVTLHHRHADNGRLTTLEADAITANFTTPEGGQPALDTFSANGSILLTHDAIQIVGDRLSYADQPDTVIAEANPGNLVTVFDAATDRHFTAESVELNLKTGQWVRRGGGTITTPR